MLGDRDGGDGHPGKCYVSTVRGYSQVTASPTVHIISVYCWKIYSNNNCKITQRLLQSWNYRKALHFYSNLYCNLEDHQGKGLVSETFFCITTQVYLSQVHRINHIITQNLVQTEL